ncbi:MAG: hypothetical protein QOG62_1357 [Thermoleophilaceae bacterium]|nr:hypothetical protein [Thermoleophilaceae bacterium]
MTRVLRATTLALLLVAVSAPGGALAAKPPEITAASAIVVDADTGEVLFEKDPDNKSAIASTTKLMTAFLTLELTKPDDVFTSSGYSGLASESTLGLQPGEKMKVKDLLTALLLKSANDAAATLAEGIAGSQKKFVDLMNQKAEELGLDSTSYANPIGLDDKDNYSTARDLTTLATKLMDDPRFAKVVGQTSATLGSGNEPRTVENRNQLVSTKLVDGVKTGYTVDAKNVLVGSGRAHGAHVISAVLGEPTESERDADTLALLEYGASGFQRYAAVKPGQKLAGAGVRLSDSAQIPLVATDGVNVTIRKGDESEVDVRVNAPPVLEGPLPAGTRIGGATVLYTGAEVGKTTLETGTAVPAPPLAAKARIALERYLPWLILAGVVIVLLVVLARSRRRRSRRP